MKDNPFTCLILVPVLCQKSRDRVDFYSKLVDHPRCFEWNIMHHAFLERSCIDLDGILCKDPTNDENDDGQNYRHFLINVEPLLRPSVEIGWIVTCRLEKYRKLTEEWLRKHSIKYKNLVMMNLPDKATRVALGNHAPI
jgi:orotate phosphoribosyltransferase